MSEVWLRLAVIGAVVAIVLVVSLLIRKRSGERPMEIGDLDLAPGVYLFTSNGCDECLAARQAIESSLGSGGYSEVAWERSPSTFRSLGITAVPTTLLVSEAGVAHVYPGMPDAALKALGP